MFAIVGDVVVCMFWGAVISLVLSILFYLVVKLFYPTYSFSIVSGISLASLAVFLFIQSFLLVGAFCVKDYMDGISSVALSVVNDTENTIQLMSADMNASMNVVEGQVDVAAIKDVIVSEYPVVGKYISGLENLHGITSNASPTQIASAVVDGLNGKINAYIWRRVFWMLGALMVTVVGFCLLVTPAKRVRYTESSRNSRRTARHAGSTSRSSHSSSRFR